MASPSAAHPGDRQRVERPVELRLEHLPSDQQYNFESQTGSGSADNPSLTERLPPFVDYCKSLMQDLFIRSIGFFEYLFYFVFHFGSRGRGIGYKLDQVPRLL
jgi:hypothetical protein